MLLDPVLGVAATFATIPFPMDVVFKAHNTHLTCPVVFVQAIAFPAAVAAGPALTVIELNSAGVYDRANCNPDIAAEEVVKDKPRLTADPAVVEPESRDSDWLNPGREMVRRVIRKSAERK